MQGTEKANKLRGQQKIIRHQALTPEGVGSAGTLGCANVVSSDSKYLQITLYQKKVEWKIVDAVLI